MSISDSGLNGIGPWDIDVLILSNREIDRTDGGHFRLNISGVSLTYGKFHGLTSCIEIGTGGTHVRTVIVTTEIAYTEKPVLLGDVVDIKVKRYGNGKVTSNFTTRYVIQFSGRDVQSLSVTRTESECAPLETCGFWNDPANWANGFVPTRDDRAYFSPRSGKVILTEDVTLRSFRVDGGFFIAHETGCPNGWSVSPADSSLG